jgi:ribosomal-protein-serine acetyltransferase
MNTLKTQHSIDSYLLRQVNLDDVANLANTVSSNLTHLRQWLPWVGDSYDSIDAESFIIQSCEKFSNDAGADYAVIYNETIIGMVGIHSIDWENGCASIGYWMGSSHCGMGITTLVVRQLLTYLSDDLLLQKIVLTAAEHNIASNKVAIKLGMEQDGLSIGHECLHGEHVNHILYQIETTHQLDLQRYRK